MATLIPAQRDEFNPDLNLLKGLIREGLRSATADYNDYVSHLDDLIEDGALTKEELTAIFTKHTKPTFESVTDAYLKLRCIDGTFANIVEGDAPSTSKHADTYLNMLAQAVAVKLVNRSIPLTELPDLSPSVSPSMT